MYEHFLASASIGALLLLWREGSRGLRVSLEFLQELSSQRERQSRAHRLHVSRCMAAGCLDGMDGWTAPTKSPQASLQRAQDPQSLTQALYLFSQADKRNVNRRRGVDCALFQSLPAIRFKLKSHWHIFIPSVISNQKLFRKVFTECAVSRCQLIVSQLC